MRTVLLACVVGLSLAGCVGQDAGPGAQETEASTPTPAPTQPWPLTGLEAPPGSDVTAGVLAVKLDNTARAFPQRGLADADIVVEEPVEGGVTRLAVLVHSALADGDELVMGPVRSVRSSDIGIVAPAGAVLVASGGAPEPVADLQAAGIETAFEGSAGFFRDPSRSAPYNLFADLVAVADAMGTSSGPQEYFSFGAAPLPGGSPAQALTLTFSPAHTTRLTAQADGWVRDLDTPDGFRADTVIALIVEQARAGYLDPGGNPVPILLTEGTGQGWIAHGGQVVDVTWAKESPEAIWTFTSAGEPVAVPPGTTYLALLPETGGSLQVDSGPASTDN